MAQQPHHEAAGERRDDAARLLRQLEVCADHGDITAAVYDRFFAIHPEAAAMFEAAPGAGPITQGRMLAYVLDLLVDQASGQSYVPELLRSVRQDHVGYGAIDLGFYADFLAALADVVHGVLGSAWQPADTMAWDRMRVQLLAGLAA
ncbi:MAG: globin [Novosphingobium sp.]|uniref:globin n=1 Tax=Novosphingobium sp. TaxID=1874826 RepID=UPI002732F9CF|nr:globin [Novosphingobium sp.]MDP3551821.1 globin [Novosphingobium sp.]